jgi:hypothetical protein
VSKTNVNLRLFLVKETKTLVDIWRTKDDDRDTYVI